MPPIGFSLRLMSAFVLALGVLPAHAHAQSAPDAIAPESEPAPGPEVAPVSEVAAGSEAMALEGHPCPGITAARSSVLLIRARGVFVGSAFLFSDRRHAVTAHHVVTGSRLTAHTTDGLEYRVEVVAVDKLRDLAFVELDREVAAPPLEATSQPVRIGDRVAAIGHPNASDAAVRRWGHHGLLRWTVTLGRVSNVSQRWVQTDAAIHSGNSGSPLLSCSGRVVGVVSHQSSHVMSFATHAQHLSLLVRSEVRPGFSLGLRYSGFLGLGVSMMQGLGSLRGGRLPAAHVELGAYVRDIVGLYGALSFGTTLMTDAADTVDRQTLVQLGVAARIRLPREIQLIPRFGGAWVHHRRSRPTIDSGEIVSEINEKKAYGGVLGLTFAWKNLALSSNAALDAEGDFSLGFYLGIGR